MILGPLWCQPLRQNHGLIHRRRGHWGGPAQDVIEVDQHEETNNERLCWAIPHSGLKPKNNYDPREEGDLWWKTTFDGKQILTGDNLWEKTTFDGRRPLTKDDLWQKTTCTLLEGIRRWTKMKMTQKRKTTFDGIQPLTEDDFWWKTTFDERWPLREDDLW